MRAGWGTVESPVWKPKTYPLEQLLPFPGDGLIVRTLSRTSLKPLEQVSI